MKLIKPAGLNSYCDLSTAHLSRATMSMLESRDHGFPFTVAPYDFGVFVGVPDELDVNTTPKDLLQVMQHAKKLNCFVVRFDADGDVCAALPAFDWDAVQDLSCVICKWPEATSEVPVCEECSKFVDMNPNAEITGTTPPSDALDDPLYRAQVQGLKDMTAALAGVGSSKVVFSTDPDSVLNRKIKVCSKCGFDNPVSQTLCVVCNCSSWAFDVDQVVCNALHANGWTLTPGLPSIATKQFSTAVGLKQGSVSLNAGDEFNRTLSGVYESEGRNILEPHGELIPKTASANDVTRIAMHFAQQVEEAVGASYAARLLHQSSADSLKPN